MIRAFILMTVKPGSEVKLSDRIQKIAGVEEVDVVYGEYDMISKVRAKSMTDLQDVAKRIRSIKEVEQTSTMVALK